MKNVLTICNNSISSSITHNAFEALLRASPCPIVLQDEQGCILEANKAFCDQFGFEPEAVMGQELNGLVLPDSRIEEGKDVDRTIANGIPLHQETVRHMADGSPLQVHLTAIPIF
jgi:PAS domain S-box-containing protein